jgi:hypothetical protein
MSEIDFSKIDDPILAYLPEPWWSEVVYNRMTFSELPLKVKDEAEKKIRDNFGIGQACNNKDAYS